MVSGIRSYEIGSGPEVLCLSGYCFDPRLYDSLGFRLVMPYLSGATYLSDPPITIDDGVSLLREYCVHTDRDPEFVVGHSWGGSIALEYAAKHGGRAFAADPAIPLSRGHLAHCMRYFLESMREFVRVPDYRKATKNILPFIGSLLRKPSVTLKQLEKIDNVEYSNNLTGVIAYGERDLFYKADQYEEFASHYDNLEARMVSGVGHNWFLHRPDIASDELRKFCTEMIL